jgi:DNA-directed RNA polymerase specialized sigma24 family protein
MNNASSASVRHGRRETLASQTVNQPMSRPFVVQKTSGVFDEWFSRCRGHLHFIACRVLGASEGAELAVQYCWLTASHNPPTFDDEGAFRGWLLRVLIDEASAIRKGHLRSRLDYERAHPSPLYTPANTGSLAPEADTP